MIAIAAIERKPPPVVAPDVGGRSWRLRGRLTLAQEGNRLRARDPAGNAVASWPLAEAEKAKTWVALFGTGYR